MAKFNYFVLEDGAIQSELNPDRSGRTLSDDIVEGTENLFFKDQRVRDFLKEGDNINFVEENNRLRINSVSSAENFDGTTDDIDEGSTNLYFTNLRSVNAVENESLLTLNNANYSGNVNVGGNLSVSGTEFITDVQKVTVNDNFIFLNSGESGGGVTDNSSGFEIDRGSELPERLDFEESSNSWKIGNFHTEVDYQNSTGSFEFNEEVVGQSSGGFVIEDTGSILKLKMVIGNFQGSETIKGQSSGETAKVVSSSKISNQDPITKRDENALDEGIAIWDNATDILTTSRNLTFDGSTLTVNGDLDLDGDFQTATTDNLSEGSSNLYFTESRVFTANQNQLDAGSGIEITVGLDETFTFSHSPTGNDSSTGNSGGTVLQNINTDGFGHVDSVSTTTLITDDIAEGSTNLYFTDARAVAAVETADPLNITNINLSGTLNAPEDQSPNCLIDITATSSLSNGTSVGYTLCVDDNDFLGLSGIADGTGGLTGDGSISVQRDMVFATDEKIELTSSQTNLGDSSVVRLNPVETDDKPAVGWFDTDGNRIAATVAHESDLHYSIETQDSAGALQTRLEVPYGSDQVTIQTQDANFKVSAGSDFEVGTGAGADSVARFWSDVFQFTTDDVGFGDKDWETEGLEGAKTKFEFYRQSSTSQLLIHNDDGSSDAVLFLRSGTTDWKLANEGENIRMFDDFTNNGMELTDDGLLTVDDSWQRRLANVSSATTTSGHDFYSVDSSGGVVTVTLASSDAINGRVINVKRNGTNTVTIDTEGSETVEGGNEITIADDGNAVTLVFNSSLNDWQIY